MSTKCDDRNDDQMLDFDNMLHFFLNMVVALFWWFAMFHREVRIRITFLTFHFLFQSYYHKNNISAKDVPVRGPKWFVMYILHDKHVEKHTHGNLLHEMKACPWRFRQDVEPIPNDWKCLVKGHAGGRESSTTQAQDKFIVLQARRQRFSNATTSRMQFVCV